MHSGHAQMCSIGFYCLVLLAPYLKVLGFLEKLAFFFFVSPGQLRLVGASAL